MARKFLIASGYILATVIIIGGTFLLVAYGQGYSYDFKFHRLIHNGLVILQSTPSGAKVVADGQDPHKKTPYHNQFVAGEHEFSVSKDGFRPWHKILQVLASQVSLAQYVILFPQHIPVNVVHAYSS